MNHKNSQSGSPEVASAIRSTTFHRTGAEQFISMCNSSPLSSRRFILTPTRLLSLFLLVAVLGEAVAQNVLTNGGYHTGTIVANTTNSHTFTAAIGDSVVLRAGALTGTIYFEPWLRIYGPDGSLAGSNDPNNVAASEVVLTTTNSGTFTVLVCDGTYGGYGYSGTYQLSYVKVPGTLEISSGDEGGPVINGTLNSGSIDAGEIDAWSFTANSGDSVVVRAGALTGSIYFEPWLRVYGPDGSLMGSSDPVSVAASEVALTTTNSGTFTVLVCDGSYGGIDYPGTYQLSYVKAPGSLVISPGDEGGALTNGTLTLGTIGVGDIDAWSFTADDGDSVVVRAGALSGGIYFEPWLRVYGPDGSLVGSSEPVSVAASEVALTTTNSGTFTVLVCDGSYGGFDYPGTYQLSCVKVPGALVISPGDEGGALTNGMLTLGAIGVGDIDAWSFNATSGDNVVVRAGALSGGLYFKPWIRVYGPNGKLVRSSDPVSIAAVEVALTATNSGTFTVLVCDGSYGGYDYPGTYQLSLAHAPGDVFASPGDEGGVMINGFTYGGTNSIGDLDVWSFYGTLGDSNLFRIGTTNFTPWLRLYGPSGALVAEAYTASTGNRTNHLAYIVTNSGYYTLVSSAYYVTQVGTYSLKQSRVPPDLIMPDTQVLNEGDTLNVLISAQDPDVPFQPLAFTPIDLPPGVNFSQTGSTNASITWTTTESSGPSTNTIIASVTDVVNGTPFTRTNSFTVIVNELNEAPLLTVPGPQTVDELATLSVFASATDVDVPANPLTYSLLSPPSGMTIDGSTGEINWTPTEAQGSNSYSIAVVVTDTNPPAVNARQLSATNTFTVAVREVNTPPQIVLPGPQVVTELGLLNVSASATDSDIPANTFTYALVSPPGGMTINPNTGAIAWMPSEAQGSNVYAIAVAVTDSNPTASNAKQLSRTNSFMVTVNESNLAPKFTSVPTSQTLTELTSLNVSVAALDDDVPANPLTYALISPPSGMSINSGSGAIAWTPTEAQGSNAYTIIVTVTDTNSAAINQKQFTVTNSFLVTVNESNSPPVLTVPSPQTLDELTALNVSASATDGDVPANPLTYGLVSPPAGMSINAGNGAITWTPTEAQGPGVYPIQVTVADTNAVAINQKQFIVTNTFTVTVNESNLPPVLEEIVGQSVHYGVLLSVQAAATDPDVPVNTLLFSLTQAPTGMEVNASSGLITWTPDQTQVGTFPVTLQVIDNGSPSLSATRMFQVEVTGEGSRLAISRLGTLMQINITGDIGLDYELQYSTNLVNWTRLLQFNLDTSPYPYVDAGSATAPRRYYRLELAE